MIVTDEGKGSSRTAVAGAQPAPLVPGAGEEVRYSLWGLGDGERNSLEKDLCAARIPYRIEGEGLFALKADELRANGIVARTYTSGVAKPDVAPNPLQRVSNKGVPWKPGTYVDPRAQQVALSGAAIDNSRAWLVALAPLLIPLVSAAIGATGFVVGFIVAFAVNTACVAWDKSYLASRGVSRRKLDSWLMPTYLHRRATVLRQPQTFLVVWIIAFVVSIGASSAIVS